MNIGILSRGPRIFSTRRIVEAIRERGHTARVMDPLLFSISLQEQTPDLFYQGKPLKPVEAIIPRIGASITYYGTALVRQFEQMNVFCANTAGAITNSRDKLRSLQILSRYDIGIPPTEFVRRKQDVLPAIERVGGAPVIIKLLEGTQGVGVILADSIKIAEAIIETLQSTRQNVLIQKFVSESAGKDIRAFVVGDQVVAAMRRQAQGQEFRSNVHRGGKTENVELPEKYEQTAVRAAQIMGLQIAGVDMLETSEGPQIMEVNSSPGLEGIEGATGVDVAGKIVDYVVEHVQFPEMDVRQRLTVTRGYTVSELPVPAGSELIGKTIAGSGLREKDIVVMMLTRDGRNISNPRVDRVIEEHDRLLCYGKVETMKQFLPLPVKRKRKKTTKTTKDAKS